MVNREPPTIAVIGAAMTDIIARPRARLGMATSNAGTIRVRHGGVARNVAVALARLGAPVRLVARVGMDSDGDAIIAGAADAGVDVSSVFRCDATATGRYVALHDEHGDLVSAVVDLGALADLDGIKSMVDRAAPCGMWLVDANLNEAGLEEIAGRAARRVLCADAVSVPKAPHLRPVLGRLDCLFANRAEAAAIADVDPAGPLPEIAGALRDRGLRAGVVTDGARPALAYTETATVMRAPFPAEVHAATGAGDALIAGVLARLVANVSLTKALDHGLAAAAIAIADPDGVDALTRQAVARMLATRDRTPTPR